MSEDKKLQHQHDFDGIEELDNDLPSWWLGIFAVTILFAAFYVPYYHFMHPEKLPEAAYAEEMDKLQAKKAEAAAEGKVEADSPADREAELQEMMAAGGWKESAQADYNTYCMACHTADGGGLVGPNFTDDYYIHGGRLVDIIKVITEGVPDKGMIAWGSQLKPEQIRNLAFFIRDLRGTTPANPKAAEGRLVDEAGNFVDEDPAAGE